MVADGRRHRWIFRVLERAGLPIVLQTFPRQMYLEAVTDVQHTGAAGGQFAMGFTLCKGMTTSGLECVVTWKATKRNCLNDSSSRIGESWVPTACMRYEF